MRTRQAATCPARELVDGADAEQTDARILLPNNSCTESGSFVRAADRETKNLTDIKRQAQRDTEAFRAGVDASAFGGSAVAPLNADAHVERLTCGLSFDATERRHASHTDARPQHLPSGELRKIAPRAITKVISRSRTRHSTNLAKHRSAQTSW